MTALGSELGGFQGGSLSGPQGPTSAPPGGLLRATLVWGEPGEQQMPRQGWVLAGGRPGQAGGALVAAAAQGRWAGISRTPGLAGPGVEAAEGMFISI